MEQRISETGTLTTLSLIVIAILAIITILGILWGMRLRRQRAEAETIEAARVEDEGGSAPKPGAALVETTPAPPAPAPVAPAPPPIADTLVVATPEPTPLANEPIAAAAPLDASPATVAEPAAPAAASLADRPVTLLKGLGPKVATLLADHGITTIGDIADLDATRAEALDARLGPFTGRMARDRWIEQARFLAAGDTTGFEAVFGKL